MTIRLLSLALLFWMTSGCKARDIASDPVVSPSSSQATVNAPAPVAAPVTVVATHRLVPEPPAALGQQPLLWVALADHLGGRATAAPLRLNSAGEALTLIDSTGRQWSGPSVVITWREVPLETPIFLARRIAGPYASFESAERVAKRWRDQGVKAQLAHPNEWEVWAPKGSAAPEGISVRDWSGELTATVEPVFQGLDGGYTLKGPVQIQAPQGLRWKGGVYRGPFRLQADAYGGWTLVEQVPLEQYLEGVVPHEIGAGSPAAALQAQTVLARTWALANSHRFRIDGYHLCSDTQCQVYSDPRQAGPAVRQAIAATKGRLLSWQGTPISAVYHATNGGVMAAGPEAWAMDAAPYLKAEADGDQAWQVRHRLPLQQSGAVEAPLSDQAGAYGVRHPLFRWRRTLTATEVIRALGHQAAGLKSPLSISVLERGASGRVLALQISGAGDAAPVVLKLDRIRRTLRRLPSTLFVITPQASDSWLVVGGGFGHGAGLSQAGAIDLAWRGWSTEKILEHYYPGTVYGPLPVKQQSP